MADLAATDDLFFVRTGLDRGRVQGIVDDALLGTDDGELFLEYRQSESIVFDDGKVKSATFDTRDLGFAPFPAKRRDIPMLRNSAKTPSAAPVRR